MKVRVQPILRKLLPWLLVLMLLLGAGYVLWQRRNHTTQTASNGTSVTVVPPRDPSRVIKEPLTQFVNGLMGTYIDQTSGSACERIHNSDGSTTDQCYQLNTIMFLVDGDMTSNVRQVVANANNSGWQMDGHALNADGILGTVAASVATDKSRNPSAAAQTQLAFAMITPKLFGEQSFIKKGNLGAIFQAYSMDDSADSVSESDMLYTLRSEIPAPANYDFQGKILDPLKTDHTKAVMVIAAGPLTKP